MIRSRVVGLLILLLGLVGCGPAQIGIDKEAFKAVDALYTAVSLRESPLLDRSEGDLQRLRDAGKLPASAFDALASIIQEARGGHWEPAQERLARFMKGQRR